MPDQPIPVKLTDRAMRRRAELVQLTAAAITGLIPRIIDKADIAIVRRAVRIAIEAQGELDVCEREEV